MERRLAAILAADIVGYSRLMEGDEIGVLSRQGAQFETAILPNIRQFNGRIVKTTGDGFLAEFQSVVDAVNCAFAFQADVERHNATEPDHAPICYRAGINIGDIIIQGTDIFGDGVNVAARLEAIAPPNGVCVSELVWQNLRGTLGQQFQDIGPQQFKNIDRQIGAWRWPADENAPVAAKPKSIEPDPQTTLYIGAIEYKPGDGEAQDFCEGLSNDVVVALSKLDTIRIVTEPDSGETAARYSLLGQVRTAGARMRCTMRLSKASSGSPVWAEKFDGMLDDVFDFQDQITNAVAAAVEIELAEGEQARGWRAEAGDTTAYQQFLEARSAYKEYSRTGNARAQKAYKAALAASPGFLTAAVGLARCKIETVSFGWSGNPKESFEEARQLLNGVFTVDPDHAAAHAELSHLLMREFDYPAARLEAELAIALDPNYADAHNCLSFILVCMGQPENALYAARQAIQLNPGTPEFYLTSMGEAYVALGRGEEAVAVADRILARRPAWVMAHVTKILGYHLQGDLAAAKQAVEAVREVSPRFTIDRWRRALNYPQRSDITQLAGRLAEAGLPEGGRSGTESGSESGKGSC